MSTPTNGVEHGRFRISISHRAWEVSVFLVLAGGTLAAGGWYCLAYAGAPLLCSGLQTKPESLGKDTEKLALLPKQTNALVVASVGT